MWRSDNRQGAAILLFALQEAPGFKFFFFFFCSFLFSFSVSVRRELMIE